MQIESKIQREGGSDIDLGGIIYEFRPLPDGAHVADVADEDHVARFLAIPEGYRLYKPGQNDEPATADGAGCADDLEVLRAQYQEKFGKAPHHAMKADSIKAKLAEAA